MIPVSFAASLFGPGRSRFVHWVALAGPFAAAADRVGLEEHGSSDGWGWMRMDGDGWSRMDETCTYYIHVRTYYYILDVRRGTTAVLSSLFSLIHGRQEPSPS